MTTFATLTANVADYINRTDLNTQIGTAVNRAIQYYANNQRFWFNETISTFNTVAGQLIYTSADAIPTLITEIDYVKIALSPSLNIELVPRTYKYIQDRVVSTIVTSFPSDYAYYKQNFYVYPIAAAVYPITVSYTKSYVDLSAGSDANDFTNNGQDLIEARACWWIYSRILKNTESAALSKADETEAFLSLQAETIRITGSGKTKPSSW